MFDDDDADQYDFDFLDSLVEKHQAASRVAPPGQLERATAPASATGPASAQVCKNTPAVLHQKPQNQPQQWRQNANAHGQPLLSGGSNARQSGDGVDVARVQAGAAHVQGPQQQHPAGQSHLRALQPSNHAHQQQHQDHFQKGQRCTSVAGHHDNPQVGGHPLAASVQPPMRPPAGVPAGTVDTASGGRAGGGGGGPQQLPAPRDPLPPQQQQSNAPTGVSPWVQSCAPPRCQLPAAHGGHQGPHGQGPNVACRNQDAELSAPHNSERQQLQPQDQRLQQPAGTHGQPHQQRAPQQHQVVYSAVVFPPHAHQVREELQHQVQGRPQPQQLGPQQQPRQHQQPQHQQPQQHQHQQLRMQQQQQQQENQQQPRMHQQQQQEEQQPVSSRQQQNPVQPPQTLAQPPQNAAQQPRNLAQQPQGSAKSGKEGGAVPAPTAPSLPVTFTATFALEENKRFVVRVGYHESLKAVFGLIAGASPYEHAVKGWTFPLGQYNNVMDALTDGRLKTRGLQVTVQQDVPTFAGRMLQAAASRTNDERLYDKLLRRPHEGEQSLDEKMMPFQREGVRHSLRLGGRVLIGDEMGLGKTVQACCLLRCYSEEWPALVVVPKSLRETWADALFTWLKLTDQEVFVINTTKDADKLSGTAPKPRVVIVSYDQLVRVPDKLRALKARVVVLDEAHYIKNGKAQRTQAALPLIKQARRAVLLTGTPALSKPVELVPLLQALMPSADIKPTDFGERYCVPDRRYPGKFFGARNEGELNRLLQGTVMVRRLKKDVLKHLPAKRRQQIFIRLPEKDMRKVASMGRELEGIKAVADSVMSGGGPGLQGVCRDQQQAIMRLWRETAALKAAAVAEYCFDLLEGDGAKFLLFAHHQVLLDAVEEQVKARKAGYIRIDGSTSSGDRGEFVRRFQEDADVKVAILSIKAAGVGLTLTASSLVVFAELSWVPGDIQQAEDRCHRIGQHTSVNIHFLLVRGSIDEIMWDTVQTKLGNVGKVLDGSGAFIKVDATREVHGLGAGGSRTVKPADADHPHSAVGGEGPEDSLAGPVAGGKPPAGAGGCARAGGGAGADETGRSGAGRSSAAAAVVPPAGTRRISDFFAPSVAAKAPNSNVTGAAGEGEGAGCIVGQKRGRAQQDEVDLISDDDDDLDFKGR